MPKKVKAKEHIMLVGKGMTLDMGVYCIKDRANMFKMNNDMGVASAVIGAMHAIAALQQPESARTLASEALRIYAMSYPAQHPRMLAVRGLIAGLPAGTSQ